MYTLFGKIKIIGQSIINTSNDEFEKSGIKINKKVKNGLYVITAKGYKKSKSNIKLFVDSENNTNEFQQLDDNWTFITKLVEVVDNNLTYGFVFDINNMNDSFIIENISLLDMNFYFTKTPSNFNNLLDNYQKDIITVIMPVHNVDKYIETAILSITRQSYKKWELIIVNDNSTDNTELIINKYALSVELNKKLIERGGLGIKYIKNFENLGKFVSLNKALMVSKGQYVTVIDGDDLFHVNKLVIQLNKLKTGIPYTSCNFTRFKNYNMLKFIIKNRYNKSIYYPNSIMYDKKIINKVGYYDSVRFGADTEFHNRVKQYYRIPVQNTYMNMLLYYALDRPGSLVTSEDSDYNSYPRKHYHRSYGKWHMLSPILHISFPLLQRPFLIHPKNSPFV
jgi:hypothetical protein